MAQGKENNESLSDFTFSNEEEFFNIPVSDINKDVETIREVKGQKTSGKGNADTTDLDDEPLEEDDEDDTEFFGIKKEGTKSKTKAKVKAGDDDDEDEGITSLDEDEDKKEDKKKTTKAKVKEEDDEEEEEEPEVTTKKGKKEVEPEGKEEEEDKFFSTLASEMKEKGILQMVDVPKDEVLTEDSFFELQAQEVEARVEAGLEAFAKDMDDDGKAFIKFKKNGGKSSDFIKNYIQGSFDLETLDVDDPAQVKKVLKFYVTTQEKLDGEELDDRLTWLKDSGKEKTYAAKWFDTIKAKEKERKQAVLQAAEDAKTAREEADKQFNEELEKVLNKTETVGVVPITKADQKEINDYIIKPKVKVGKNRFVPQFNIDLNRILEGKTEEDKQQLAALALMIKRKFKLDSLLTKVTTKITNKTESKLRQAKNGGVSMKSSGNQTQRQLADYFGEE